MNKKKRYLRRSYINILTIFVFSLTTFLGINVQIQNW